MRWLLTFGVLAALAAAGCEPWEPACPACEDRCWEGERQCTRCKKKNGCPVDELAPPRGADPWA